MRMIVVMIMVMIVPVKCQCATGSRAKKCTVFRGGSDDCRCALTTYVAVQADHPIRSAHDDVQFVTDHQNGAARFLPNRFDLAIELG